MKWLGVLLLTALAAGFGCREAGPVVERPDTSRQREIPVAVDVSSHDLPEVEPSELESAGDGLRWFAPSDRFGWPDEFRLPLVIDIEVPEVPEGHRGPSPPIEQPN